MTSPDPIATSGRIDVPVAHGQLEAILKERPDPFAAVVVCHPHPQGGGTMHNNVVYRVAKALGDAGATVLRFNFRGVGRSTGSYGGGLDEEEDARAALDFLEQHAPGVPLWRRASRSARASGWPWAPATRACRSCSASGWR